MIIVNSKIPPSAGVDYNIFIENNCLPNIGEALKNLAQDKLKKVKTFAVITDKNVSALYEETVVASLAQAGYKVLVISLLAGEKSKSIVNFFAVNNWLAENQITRSDALIALGGGVIGDLTGFTAACYLRGVPFIQVPTTLLAMVDSSVGGKTGIDIPAGKNLVGAFYQPQAVICDPQTLSTLPPEVFADGMAEVIKHGMIRSEKLLRFLENNDVNKNLPHIIEENVKIKRDIVERDQFDTGERQLLNFGHTIGHAIEKLSNYEISHGNAVAMGMLIITRAAVRKNFCPAECLSTLDKLLAEKVSPKIPVYSAREIYEASLTDKKRMGDYITEVIPRAIGECILHKIPVTDLLEWIEMGVNQ